MTKPIDQFYLKAGDRKPILLITLYNDEGTPRNLTGISSAKLVVAPCVEGRRLVDKGSMTVDADTSTGRVTYAWTGAELVPGDYLMEIILNDGLTTQETFPHSDYYKLTILPHL